MNHFNTGINFPRFAMRAPGFLSSLRFLLFHFGVLELERIPEVTLKGRR
jgi:hypothetical protein